MKRTRRVRHPPEGREQSSRALHIDELALGYWFYVQYFVAAGNSSVRLALWFT